MIQAFFTTVQQDFTTLQQDMVLAFNKMTGKAEDTMEQNMKVTFAAGRIIGAVGMLFSALFTLSALPFFLSAPVGRFVQMAIGTAVFAIFHDLFTMSKNASVQVAAGIKDAPPEELTENTIFHPLLTENTVFRPVWDPLVAKILESA